MLNNYSTLKEVYMNRTKKKLYTYLLYTTLMFILGQIFLYFIYQDYLHFIKEVAIGWTKPAELIIFSSFLIIYIGTFFGFLISYRLYKDSKKLQNLLNHIEDYACLNIELVITDYKETVFVKKDQTSISNEKENFSYDNCKRYVYPNIILLEDGRYFGLNQDVIKKSDKSIYLIKENEFEHFFLKDLYLSLCSFEEIYLQKM